MIGLTSEWKKSTRSNGSDGCVEARSHAGFVEVRDSKDQSGPVLRFTPADWVAFLGDVRGADSDLG